MYVSIMNDMKVVGKDVNSTLAKSIEYTKNQIAFKLNQLEATLHKIENSNKHDKLSALIDTVLGSF